MFNSTQQNSVPGQRFSGVWGSPWCALSLRVVIIESSIIAVAIPPNPLAASTA